MCHREISPWCLVNVRKEFFQTLEKRHPASPTTRARTSANRDLRVRPCFEHGADNGVVFARGLRGGAVAGKLEGGIKLEMHAVGSSELLEKNRIRKYK